MIELNASHAVFMVQVSAILNKHTETKILEWVVKVRAIPTQATTRTLAEGCDVARLFRALPLMLP